MLCPVPRVLLQKTVVTKAGLDLERGVPIRQATLSDAPPVQSTMYLHRIKSTANVFHFMTPGEPDSPISISSTYQVDCFALLSFWFTRLGHKFLNWCFACTSFSLEQHVEHFGVDTQDNHCNQMDLSIIPVAESSRSKREKVNGNYDCNRQKPNLTMGLSPLLETCCT
jgi:hypothetical protein